MLAMIVVLARFDGAVPTVATAATIARVHMTGASRKVDGARMEERVVAEAVPVDGATVLHQEELLWVPGRLFRGAA